jgi:hypothetical protein
LALLLGAFLIGGVTGAVLDRTLAGKAAREASESRRGRDRGASYLDWLSQELALSEQQRNEVAAVLERNREEVAALWEETRPAFEEVRNRLRAEVQELLTDEQRVVYDALIASERDRRRRR